MCDFRISVVRYVDENAHNVHELMCIPISLRDMFMRMHMKNELHTGAYETPFGILICHVLLKVLREDANKCMNTLCKPRGILESRLREFHFS